MKIKSATMRAENSRNDKTEMEYGELILTFFIVVERQLEQDLKQVSGGGFRSKNLRKALLR